MSRKTDATLKRHCKRIKPEPSQAEDVSELPCDYLHHEGWEVVSTQEATDERWIQHAERGWANL